MAYYWSHKHQFEEKLLEHINNRPTLELLLREKNFIYKNKEVVMNFDIVQQSGISPIFLKAALKSTVG